MNIEKEVETMKLRHKYTNSPDKYAISDIKDKVMELIYNDAPNEEVDKWLDKLDKLEKE